MGARCFSTRYARWTCRCRRKLLRVLQSGMVQPVGAARAHKVDLRIVSATNRNPEEEVRAGRFREDLYYRLHVIPLEVPPLRARGDDVLLIARAVLGEMAAEEGRSFTRFSSAAEAAIRAHRWPGNVRQLRNVIRNAVVLNDGPVLELDMLRDALGGNTVLRGEARAAGEMDGVPGIDAVDALVGLPLAEMGAALHGGHHRRLRRVGAARGAAARRGALHDLPQARSLEHPLRGHEHGRRGVWPCTWAADGMHCVPCRNTADAFGARDRPHRRPTAPTAERTSHDQDPDRHRSGIAASQRWRRRRSSARRSSMTWAASSTRAFNEAAHAGAEALPGEETGIAYRDFEIHERQRSASRRCAGSRARATTRSSRSAFPPRRRASRRSRPAVPRDATSRSWTWWSTSRMCARSCSRSMRARYLVGMLAALAAGSEGDRRLRRRHGHPADPQVRVRLRRRRPER